MPVTLVAEAVIGATFGSAFTALYEVVKGSICMSVKHYKPLLRDLEFTLECLTPRNIQQIEEHNRQLGISNEDIERLQGQMREGKSLVTRVSNLGRWNCYITCCCCKPNYVEQLDELNRSLRWLLERLKVQEANDVKELLVLARKFNDKQDKLEGELADLRKVLQKSGAGGESSGSGAETTPNEQTGENGGQQVAPSGGGVGAAALGKAFGLLFDAVMRVNDKTTMLKRPLGDLKSTLDSVKPLIEEVAKCSKVLNLPKEELEDVGIQMEKGAELVSNCSKVRQWSSYKTYEYTNKLRGLDKSLQRLLTVLRVQLARDVRESLDSISNIEAAINQIKGSGVVKLQNEQNEAKGSCEAPTAMAKSAVGLNALSVEGTRNVTETLDPEANIKVGWQKVESSVAQSKTEHPSRTVGLGAMNMQVEARSMEETSVSDVEAGLKRIQGKEVYELDAPFRELKEDVLKDEEDEELDEQVEDHHDRKKEGVESVTGASGDRMSSCKADGCAVDLSDAKASNRRHRVCELHSKAPLVIVSGLKRRFCHKCSRFHDLSEFDDTKQSCRRHLPYIERDGTGTQLQEHLQPETYHKHQIKFRKMGSGRLGEMLHIGEETIKESCFLAFKAHKSPGDPFLVENSAAESSDVVISFPAGTWSVESLFSGESDFGEAKVDLELFPSLKSVGNYDPEAKPEERDFATATINQAFVDKVKQVLDNSQLKIKVQEAINAKKRIIFTGHSTGGAIAAFVTIWFLENCSTEYSGSFFCVTFGSPLIGDHIISHALRRENWSEYFIHFVMRYDIVPRILLAPLSSIRQEFEKILPFFDPNSSEYMSQSIGSSRAALDLFTKVMSSASSVASSAASKLMGTPNLLLETVTKFINLSPYKPFGTYIFFTGNEKLVVLKTPEAVLQLLFFTCHLNNETERATIASKCLNQHLGYYDELEASLNMQSVTCDDNLEMLNLASDGIFDDLGLSARARQCLRAAGVFQKQKQENKDKFDSKKEKMEEEMKKLRAYRGLYKDNVGYYDAFKLQNAQKDFEANVSRLELAAYWDEITEMLKKYDLPDEFEATSDWVTRGTTYRRLVEPLDIANFYRHAKGEDTGIYMRGRPKRYKYLQRWLEHEKKLPVGSRGESCFWAELEELHKLSGDLPAVNKEKKRVLNLQEQVGKWIVDGVLGKDVLKSSTFQAWWSELPIRLKTETISGLMNGAGDMQVDDVGIQKTA